MSTCFHKYVIFLKKGAFAAGAARKKPIKGGRIIFSRVLFFAFRCYYLSCPLSGAFVYYDYNKKVKFVKGAKKEGTHSVPSFGVKDSKEMTSRFPMPAARASSVATVGLVTPLSIRLMLD